VIVATVGNSIGGMVNYWLGFGAHQVLARDRHTPRALAWLERMGPKACFFAFLPAIGDPLTAVAGWLLERVDRAVQVAARRLKLSRVSPSSGAARW
jgi:membrane protein YqaA with SNARE-associated domain